MMSRPSLPPLLTGMAAAGACPFEAACAEAQAGCDGGLLVHDVTPFALRAAVVFAPDVALAQAMAMLPLCAVAMQNALGVLGPSELPVQLEWQGAFRVNGGLCGGVRAAASGIDPQAVPDWLVVGVDMPFAADIDSSGETPDRTALMLEGCGDVAPMDLLESWARHMLNWLHRWETDGVAPLHRDWTGLAHGLGQEVRVGARTGVFLGVDEALGMLLKEPSGTALIPLTALLETNP